MMKLLVIITLAITLTAASALAQGGLLRPDESGFGASGMMSFGNDPDVYGLSFGTSPGGYFDLSFSYATDESSNVNSYSPSFTYYFKNNQPNTMTGIGLTVGYTHLEVSGRSSSADYASLGVSLFANLYASRVLAFQAAISGELAYSLRDTYDRTATAFAPSMTIIFAHHEQIRPTFGVAYVTTDEEGGDYGSVGIGFIVAW